MLLTFGSNDVVVIPGVSMGSTRGSSFLPVGYEMFRRRSVRRSVLSFRTYARNLDLYIFVRRSFVPFEVVLFESLVVAL